MTIVVDTSAAAAVLFSEPGAGRLIDLLDEAEQRLISAATVVELGLVVESRIGPEGAVAVERLLREGEIEVVPFDGAHAARAAEGWRRFGKGRHPAALNLGDCFTYGLASVLGYPVLCVGHDFHLTDVEVRPAVT